MSSHSYTDKEILQQLKDCFYNNSLYTEENPINIKTIIKLDSFGYLSKAVKKNGHQEAFTSIQYLGKEYPLTEKGEYFLNQTRIEKFKSSPPFRNIKDITYVILAGIGAVYSLSSAVHGILNILRLK